MQSFSVPLQLFIEGSIMSSVIDFDGVIHHMSPELLRVLGVSSGRLQDVPDRSLLKLLPEVRARERLMLLRRAISGRRPCVLRSVVGGTQFITHIFPLDQHPEVPQSSAFSLHLRTEGRVERDHFPPGSDYLEAEHNDFGPLALLTKREAEVLALLSEGADGPEIADRLHRSAETVSSHQKSLYAKLRCPSRMHAMIIARRAGLSMRDVPRILSPRSESN
jgi:DNA-binding CsgD family transcriptional regulator